MRTLGAGKNFLFIFLSTAWIEWIECRYSVYSLSWSHEPIHTFLLWFLTKLIFFSFFIFWALSGWRKTERRSIRIRVVYSLDAKFVWDYTYIYICRERRKKRKAIFSSWTQSKNILVYKEDRIKWLDTTCDHNNIIIIIIIIFNNFFFGHMIDSLAKYLKFK